MLGQSLLLGLSRPETSEQFRDGKFEVADSCLVGVLVHALEESDVQIYYLNSAQYVVQLETFCLVDCFLLVFG